jgi:hypothetical protein
MKIKQIISILVAIILLLTSVATLTGITSNEGLESFSYQSIRGEEINIYGRGLYKHMSSDVAVQGIAQDYVTLLIGIPILLIAWLYYQRGSYKGQLVLVGALLYFLVTYLFYLSMGMYNELFLVYTGLLATSFFGVILTIYQLGQSKLDQLFIKVKLYQYAASFVTINCLLIAIMWLGIIVPPLISGEIYPTQLQHYTTLIVQGFDLGLLLPIGFALSYLTFKKQPQGYLGITIYLVFLSLLMLALTSKVLFMWRDGQNVVPVIFIMPLISLIAGLFSFNIIKNLQNVSKI